VGQWVSRVFSRGFEEGRLRPTYHSASLTYLQAACHNNPLMVPKISDYSRRINVETRKIQIDISRNLTVQRHIPTPWALSTQPSYLSYRNEMVLAAEQS